MIDEIMRRFGYISEKNLVLVSKEVYLRNDTSKAKNEKEFYYNSGNANAIGYILGRFGIDVTKI